MTFLLEQHTNRVRAITIWVLRAISVSLVTVGSYLALKKILFAIGSGQQLEILQTWTGVGEEHSLYRGLAMVAVGLVLAVASRRIARWTIIVPEYGCPACGYDHALQTGVPCSECGYPPNAAPPAAKPM